MFTTMKSQRRSCGGRMARFAGAAVALALNAAGAQAADLAVARPAPAAADSPVAAQAPAPLGVFGVDMLGEGKISVSLMPSFARLGGPQMGRTQVSPPYVISNVVSGRTPVGAHLLRMVPTSFEFFSQSASIAYGLTPNITLVAATSFLEKNVNMLTFKGLAGFTPLGTSTGHTEGFGDTMVAGVWRVYQDGMNQVNVNLGLSLPTGGTTNVQTLLLPNGTAPSNIAFYGMQEGSGTVDALPGVAYSGVLNAWSWGASYRARLALGDNTQGWRYGEYQEVNAWGGYTWTPGLETTLRINASTQTAIHGLDPLIKGYAQGANPYFYGGEHVDVFGGANISGRFFGVPAATLAIEAGLPLYQNLNGPQAARDWQIGMALRYKI